MFDTVCTLPLTSDLFAQSIHPDTPLIALGLASGHVQIHRLPLTIPNDGATIKSGYGTIETTWRTHRHKGSCRSLTFSSDGAYLFSAGTDGLVKTATTETGQVVSKIAVPQHGSTTDPASLIYAITPQSFLLATDSSALYLYDLRANSTFAAATPQQTHHPHDDFISSITPLPPGETSTSGTSKQWVSTGGTTVAVTDLRRGILVKSEDLGEELLSSTNIGEQVVVGGERGLLRAWQRGEWNEEEEMVMVAKGKNLDVLSAIPEGVGAENASGDVVAVGMEDGRVMFVKLGKRKSKVVGEVRHDDVEGVLALGFEVGGRMISGGGSIVKVWEESVPVEEAEEDDEDAAGAVDVERSGEDDRGPDDSDDAEEDSSEEEKVRKKRKKRKRNKGKGKSIEKKQVIAFKGID